MLKTAILATVLVVASAGSLALREEYPEYGRIDYENSRHRQLEGYDRFGGFARAVFTLGSYGLGGYDGYRFFGFEDDRDAGYDNRPENKEAIIQETPPSVVEERDDEQPEIPTLGRDEKYIGLFDDHSLASNPTGYNGDTFEDRGYLVDITDIFLAQYEAPFPNVGAEEAQAGDEDEERATATEETPNAEDDDAEAGDEPEAIIEEDQEKDNAHGFGIYDNLLLWGLDSRPGYGGFYNGVHYGPLALA